MRSLLSLLAVAQLFAAAPVDPRIDGLRALREADRRVATITFRLQTRAVDLCSEKQFALGLVVQTLDEYQPGFRAAARTAFGLGDRAGVLAVVPQGPAAEAGLAEDDMLVSIDGAPVPAADPPPRASYALTAAIAARLAMVGPAAIQVEVVRQTQPLKLRIAAQLACSGNVQLDPIGGLNAAADTRTIAITTELLEFCHSDDELALAIGHELAHHILRHSAVLDAQHVDRGVLRVLPGNARRIRATEQQADRLGLYLMARAGYDYHIGPAFWSRFGRAEGPAFLSDGTHPGAAQRIASSARIAAEIDALKRAGQPLTPADLALALPKAPPSGDTSARIPARLR